MVGLMIILFQEVKTAIWHLIFAQITFLLFSPTFYFPKSIILYMCGLYVSSNLINKYAMSDIWQEWN